MSIQSEKTKHQSLFKTVNKAGSSNGGGGHAGDSNGGEMVFGTHFPFFPFGVMWCSRFKKRIQLIPELMDLFGLLFVDF